MFTEKFDSYVCVGDTISTEVEGFKVIARIEHDPDSHIDDADCHNVDQSVTGCDDIQQEKLLEARKAWFNGEWFYCGVVLSVSYKGYCLAYYAASLWAIEANYPGSDNSYLTDVANELLQEAVTEGREILETLRS
jgi:hypothetical protein